MNQIIDILVIEDDETDFRLTQRQIKRSGINANCVRVDTREALTQALKTDNWSLILLDYNIPEVAFKDALRLIQQQKPDIPIILVSGNFEEERGLELLKRGLWDFVPKDNLTRLPAVIDRSLQEALSKKLLKKTKEELHNKEQKFQTYVENSPISIWVFDQQWRFIDSNPAGRNLLNYSGQTLYEMHLYDVVRAEERGLLMEDLQRLVCEGRLVSEYSCVRTDGEERIVQIHAVKLPDNTILSYCQDMTELRQAEYQLRIAALAFESNDSIIIINANKKIQRVNHAFGQTTGYTSDEVIGKDLSLLESEKNDPSYYKTMWRAVEEKGAWQGEKWSYRKNGEHFLEWLSITGFKSPDGQLLNYVAVSRDITERKATEEKIARLALYDSLTNLPNRRLLLDRLKVALETTERSKQIGALMFIDLDHFKLINDTLGHDSGDRLLMEVSNRLRGCARKSDTLARLGGDEFVILLENLSGNETLAAMRARSVAKIILFELGKEFHVANNAVNITPSVGVALFNGQDATGDDLLKWADLAMYQAKSSGRNTFRFFDPIMQANIEARAELEADLHRAIQEKQFMLHFQPKFSKTNVFTGFEALIRWNHPVKGLISPINFISVAEETGMIQLIGSQVIEAACNQLEIWHQKSNHKALSVAVNVSAKQFRNPFFVEEIETLLARTHNSPGSLIIELTESLAAENIEDVVQKMLLLKNSGVKFALDDFGTGYSSLAYLQSLPFDYVKIDQSFVCDLPENANQASLVKAIIAMAHSMGLEVIAEGVETKEQWDFLCQEGCDEAQGFLFSEALPAAEIPMHKLLPN